MQYFDKMFLDFIDKAAVILYTIDTMKNINFTKGDVSYEKSISILLSTFIAALSLTNIVSGSSISANEREPVEVVSLRSEYEKHFDNGDGTMTAFIDTVPLHYYDNGSWLEIDNTIIEDENGNYVNKSNSMDVTFVPTASADSIDSIDNEQMVSIDYNGYYISWDFVKEQSAVSAYDSLENVLMPESHILINESLDKFNIDSSKAQLNKVTAKSVSKLDSSVSYNSLFNNVDVDIDVRSNSVKETIVLNDKNSVPENFTYYIKAKGLNAEIYEDNSIHFLNESDEDIFKIPAPYMFDSSENTENNYDIKFNIEGYEDGYLLTLTPDINWILSEERVYPVMIDPEIKVENSEMRFSYNSEANPGLTYSENFMKVGNELNNSYQGYVQFNLLFSGIHENATVTNADLYMYARPISLSRSKRIDVYSLNIEPRGTCWAVDSELDKFNTYISSFYVTNSSNYTVYNVDITSLAQAWLNNIKTSRTGIGVPSYGIKMVASDTPKTTVEFNVSSKAIKSYCLIDYVIDTDYTLQYAPYKYNDMKEISNFQKRMNCYSYALQAYYGGNLDSGISYKLKTGELGISHQLSTDKFKISNYAQLINIYDEYTNKIINTVKTLCTNTPGRVYDPAEIDEEIMSSPLFLDNMASYSDFVEEQMMRDSRAMNFTINKMNSPNKFTLPNDFDESSEGIIAMVSYYLVSNVYSGVLDTHFYLRNGNGTCPYGHGHNCSMWTNKQGDGDVKNWVIDKTDMKLCDETINGYGSIVSRYLYLVNEKDIRFYRITKDTNVYDSVYGNGQYADSKGTPYTKH